MIPSNLTPESHGLGTVESRYGDLASRAALLADPGAEGLDYLEYWTGPYMRALGRLGLLTQAEHDKLHPFNKFMLGLTQTVVREGARTAEEFLEEDSGQARIPFAESYLIPELNNTDGSALYNAVRVWDRGLGGLNLLVDAQADHLRVAGLLLADNSNPKNGEFNPASDDRSVYHSFVSMWKNNTSEELPLPARLLNPASSLLAGQIIHRAGLLDTNTYRQATLTEIASEIYDQLSSSLPLDSEVGYAAKEFGRDLKVRGILEKLRASANGSNPNEKDEAAAALKDVVIEIAEEIASLPSAHDTESVESGIVFEKFVKLIVLDHILRKIDKGTVLNIGVRGAFGHEDKAAKIINLKLKPLSRSDVFITRHRKNGTVSAMPVQLKKGGGVLYVARGDTGPYGGYLPLIHMPRIDVSHHDAVETSENLARRYAGLSNENHQETRVAVLRGLELMAA